MKATCKVGEAMSDCMVCNSSRSLNRWLFGCVVTQTVVYVHLIKAGYSYQDKSIAIIEIAIPILMIVNDPIL